jgi:hypothetical protein
MRTTLLAAAFMLLVGATLSSAQQRLTGDPVQSQPPAPSNETVPDGGIRGIVKAGTISMPNVKVIATYALTGAVYSVITEATGTFSIPVPQDGDYIVHAEFAGYASATQEVIIDSNNRRVTAKPEVIFGDGNSPMRLST